MNLVSSWLLVAISTIVLLSFGSLGCLLADAQVEKKEWRSENKLWWLKKSIIPFALQSIAMTLMSVLTVSLRTLMGYG